MRMTPTPTLDDDHIDEMTRLRVDVDRLRWMCEPKEWDENEPPPCAGCQADVAWDPFLEVPENLLCHACTARVADQVPALLDLLAALRAQVDDLREVLLDLIYDVRSVDDLRARARFLLFDRYKESK